MEEDDIEERIERLNNAVEGINYIQFGSLKLNEIDGLTPKECAEFKNKLMIAIKNEKVKLNREEKLKTFSVMATFMVKTETPKEAMNKIRSFLDTGEYNFLIHHAEITE